MRLIVLSAAVSLAAGAAFAQAAPDAHANQKGVEAAPVETQSGQPPFGGTFESRLDRLGGDIEAGSKQGWLQQGQAQALAGQVNALRGEVRSVRAANNGELPGADNSRLQDRVTALHKQIADLAAAARERPTSAAQ